MNHHELIRVVSRYVISFLTVPLFLPPSWLVFFLFLLHPIGRMELQEIVRPKKEELHELLYTEIWKSGTFRLASEHGSNPKPHVISEFEMSENMDSGVQCTSTYHVCLCPSINLYFKICWQSVSFLFALLTDVELYTARSWKCPNQNFNLKKMFQITFLNEKRHKPNYFLNLL